MRVKRVVAAAVAFCTVAICAPAWAQSGDAFGQCLATHTTAQDRSALVRWVFAGMAQSASVRDMAEIPEAKRVEAIRGAAAIVGRLLTHDCRAEALARFKSNPGAMQQSFGRLGQRAVEDLAQDPAVIATFAGIVQYIDMTAFARLMLEGGLSRK
ncbi:MAG: hypothetical protein ABW023_02525 [Sphingomonas sp.]